MSDLKSKVERVQAMIGQGQVLEAFDTYYADDVVMTEKGQEPRVGKQANREFEEYFVKGLTEFRGFEVKSLAVSEETGVAFVETYNDFTHKDWGDQQRTQVAIQQWKDGQIVSEEFYY